MKKQILLLVPITMLMAACSKHKDVPITVSIENDGMIQTKVVIDGQNVSGDGEHNLTIHFGDIEYSVTSTVIHPNYTKNQVSFISPSSGTVKDVYTEGSEIVTGTFKYKG